MTFQNFFYDMAQLDLSSREKKIHLDAAEEEGYCLEAADEEASRK